jgi:hypothetical protein
MIPTAPARSHGVGAVAVPAASAAGDVGEKVKIMPFGLRQLKQPVQYPACANGVGAVAVPAASAAGDIAKKVKIMPFGLRQLKQPVQ